MADDEAEHQKHQPGGGEGFERPETTGSDLPGGAKHLNHGDDREQRRALRHDGTFADDGGKRAHVKLRQDDPEPDCTGFQAECCCRLNLAGGNAGQRAAKNFCHEGRIVRRDRQNAGGHRTQADAKRGKRVERQEDLHHQRRSTDEADVETDHIVDDRDLEGADDGQQGAERQ